MTVQVTHDGGAIDEFARFADSYIKHTDGSLEIVRAGTARTTIYDAGRWTDVSGDEKQTSRTLFRRLAIRSIARAGRGRKR